VKIRGVGRRVRIWWGAAAVAIGAVAVVGQPFAHGQTPTPTVTVAVTSNVFTDRDVTINQGETVAWRRDDGFHDVTFDNPPGPTLPSTGASSSWTTESLTFNTPGTYHYVCSIHKNLGMQGTVTVRPASSPTPGPTPAPTPPPPPPPTGGSAPPQLLSVKVTRTHFCTQRSRTCKKPGVVLAIDLSGPAAVKGALTRAPLRGAARYRRFGTVDFGQVAAGKRELRFSRTKTGRRLSPARYKLVLTAAGTTRTLRFRVRTS
jgi:plastocyanin